MPPSLADFSVAKIGWMVRLNVRTQNRRGRGWESSEDWHSHVGDLGFKTLRSTVLYCTHHHQQWSRISTGTCRIPFTSSISTHPLSNSRTISFRLVSYNLRYDCIPNKITVKESLAALHDPSQEPSYLSLAGKEQPWSSRRIRIAQDLLSEGVALAGACYRTLREPRSGGILFDAALS